MTRTRISLHTGKVSARCGHIENGQQCTDAVLAHDRCFKHQGRRRLQLAAQAHFFKIAGANKQ